jgi:hypothetical protein
MQKVYNKYEALDTNMAASEANRTTALNLEQQADRGRFQLNLTHNAATEVQITLYGSVDGTNFGGLALRNEIGANALLDDSPVVIKKTVTGDAVIVSPVLDLRSLQSVKAVVDSTSGDADDTFTLVFSAEGY